MTTPVITTGTHLEKHSEASKSKDSSDEAINALLARNPVLWRGCDMSGRGDHGQTTGYPQLDDILPGRGWPRNAIVEIVSRQWGMGELQLLVPLMREVVRQGKWILWISPPYLLNSPALLQAGIDPEQVLVINLDTSCKDALWSMEKALQTDSCGLVLAWQNWLPDKVVRRLQLAAETGETLGVLFQHRISKYSQSSLRLEIKAGRGKSRDLSRGTGRGTGRGMNRDMSRDLNRDVSRDMGRDKGRDMGQDKNRHMTALENAHRASLQGTGGASIERGNGISMKQSDVGDATPVRNRHGALLGEAAAGSLQGAGGASMKHSGDSGQTEIVVLKARGNFRPLSVRLNLYQENLPLQPPGQYKNP